jgi:predicted nucleic acid-binding protein
MILLDTNVLSEPYRPQPNTTVQKWLNAQTSRDLYLCTPVLAELRYGLERLPPGNRRLRLENWLRDLEEEYFLDRVLPFDQHAAHEFGRIMSRREKMGRPIMPMDALIAAVAICYAAAIATRDTADFEGLGLDLLNPFVGGAP